MAKTEIYYFSGTGNSLHVARELQKRIPDTDLIPIISLLNWRSPRTNAKRIGFVFPIYFTSIPAPFVEFITKLDMRSSAYIFMVGTRLGTFTIANSVLKSLLKKKGKSLDASFLINMANNTPTGLKPGKGSRKWVEKTSEPEIKRLEERVQPQLDEISNIIREGKRHPKRSFPNPIKFLTYNTMKILTRSINSEVGYYADDSCIHCGTCEKVCPSGKIIISEGKPTWQMNVQCYYCFACFNFCPQQAILVDGKYDNKDGRYHHPSVTVEDIISQKNYDQYM